MSPVSEPITSVSCTAAAVWLRGISPPSPSSAAPGVPGSTSMKKLPPRKMRGRTFSSASSLIGSASSDSSIVTRPPPPASASTPVTLPTSIPAIRTGERLLRLLVSSKSARST